MDICDVVPIPLTKKSKAYLTVPIIGILRFGILTMLRPSWPGVQLDQGGRVGVTLSSVNHSDANLYMEELAFPTSKHDVVVEANWLVGGNWEEIPIPS